MFRFHKLKNVKIKMKNKFFNAIFIAAIFLLASCTLQNSKPADIDVHTGFEGLNIGFLKNTPPDKVFEGDIFPVIVKVKNNGAYSVTENSKAVLSLGVEKDYTKSLQLLHKGKIEVSEGVSSSAAFSLDGKSSINPIGSEDTVSYNIEAGKIDPQSEFHQSTVIATVCYPYETFLSSTVCIDTDVNNLRPAKKVCNAQDLFFPNGQGAPVAVTKIETRMLPAQLSEQSPGSDRIKPQFLIYVENKMPGLVIKSESAKDFCTKSDVSHDDYNIVYVDAALSNQQLTCQLDTQQKDNLPGHIKLKDRKDIIRCALEEGIDRNIDTYLSPLKVILRYGYTQSVASSYIIQKPVS